MDLLAAIVTTSAGGDVPSCSEIWIRRAEKVIWTILSLDFASALTSIL